MLNNENLVYEAGKKYIAGIDFTEGLIELKPLVKHDSGLHYNAHDFESKHTYKSAGFFDAPAYIPLSKGSVLELYVDVRINSYTREDHICFSPGYYEAGEDFREGLVRITNRSKMVTISICDSDTFKELNTFVSSADSEFYIIIEKGNLLRIYDEATEVLEYRRI